MYELVELIMSYTNTYPGGDNITMYVLLICYLLTAFVICPSTPAPSIPASLDMISGVADRASSLRLFKTSGPTHSTPLDHGDVAVNALTCMYMF